MTLSIPTVNLAAAQAPKNADASDTLKLATNANDLAKESLHEIDKLIASAQAGDSFSLQKIQSLAETALSKTHDLQAGGEANIVTTLADTGYLAQTALQKIGAAQSAEASKGAKLYAVA